MRLEARASGIGKALSEKDLNYLTNSINSSNFTNFFLIVYGVFTVKKHDFIISFDPLTLYPPHSVISNFSKYVNKFINLE